MSGFYSREKNRDKLANVCRRLCFGQSLTMDGLDEEERDLYESSGFLLERERESNGKMYYAESRLVEFQATGFDSVKFLMRKTEIERS